MTIDDVTKEQVRTRANSLYPEDDSIQSARGFWVQAGLHPPEQNSRKST
ncbi:hypothetical protein IQ247_14435 [Plectonema cf. radiosum LEGE 06105]|uniref:Uncharacterized protein n=1 Tax=Plectonema cf. radiosum LEGE 06105 TaxID=945769 RepID=A0A8J7FCS0_9CYAN|nr:hypothetical protein [Plectonema radiosum]MBE9213848.1 hypothetical protein [Plectonema cf. radiosum LEGE 06105]